jgi:SAM-dependent methyltransferase
VTPLTLLFHWLEAEEALLESMALALLQPMVVACLILLLIVGGDAAPTKLPATLDYSSVKYWEARYMRRPNTLEWYSIKWKVLNATLRPYVRPEHRVLHIGSGNSDLPEQMHSDGYLNQVATDVSGTVIRKMTAKLKHLAPNLTFTYADATNLPFEESSFDVVIEKGTLDALRVARHCTLKEKGCKMTDKERALVYQAMRVLRPGGVFVSVAEEMGDARDLRAKGLVKIERVNLERSKELPIGKKMWLLFKKPNNAPVTSEGGLPKELLEV